MIANRATENFDLIVIGGGSGGVAAAKQAADHGARCALIERSRLGGTCVNVGCVPKKIMWHAASIAHTLRHDALDYGFAQPDVDLDWVVIVQKREAYLRRLNGIYQQQLDHRQITLLKGSARMESPHHVVVENRCLHAPHILIASGGKPDVPKVPGAAMGITSDGFFSLYRMPKSVAVIGAGYIAVELAGVLLALGSSVTLFTRYNAVLRQFDPMLGSALIEQMQQDGLNWVHSNNIEALESSADGRLNVITDHAQSHDSFDTVIWAAGRSPHTEELDLPCAGVETDARGFIVTDLYQNTSADGVYALGDATSAPALTPVAIAAARKLMDRLFGNEPYAHIDEENIPSVVFSHPPIGTVGMSEPQAREAFGDQVKVYQSSFNPLSHAITQRKVKSHFKVIVSGAEETLRGIHLFGEGADEMLQGFAVVLRMGGSKKDLDRTIAIHPSGAEELVTLR